jgi:ketosteroid isomerase-like protein
MKRILFIALLSFTTSFVANSQTEVKPDKKSGNVEQAIMNMEKEMLDALLKGDLSANERYMAEDAVFTGPDGMVMSKSEVISMFKDGNLKLESSVIDDMKVNVRGNTAVATYRTTDKGKYKETDISGQYRWTDVFVKQNGEWKLVAGHGTKLMQQ